MKLGVWHWEGGWVGSQCDIPKTSKTYWVLNSQAMLDEPDIILASALVS